MKVSKICILIPLLLLLAAACHRGPKILRPKEFADLYADMILADEWVRLHPELRRSADTMLVYAEAFERHGVTSADVKANLEYYLRDPLRYSRVMDATLRRLEGHEKKIKDELDRVMDIDGFRRKFRRGAVTDTLWHGIYPDPGCIDSVAIRRPGVDSAYWHRRDSVLRVFPVMPFRPEATRAARALIARRDSL